MQKQAEQVATVLALFISQSGESQRIQKEQISVDISGVIDDKFYAKDPNRSILLSSVDSYTMAQESGIELGYGLLGENILLNYNPYTIPLDTEFSIGEVRLLITQNCTLCKSLTKIDNRLPKLLKDDRGIFAKVIKGGVIKQGDTLTIEKQEKI